MSVLSLSPSLHWLPFHMVSAGGDPAGRGDPLRSAAAGVSCGPPSPEEAQAGAHLVHDRVVHVCLLSDSAMGLSAACLGHVPLWGWDTTLIYCYTANENNISEVVSSDLSSQFYRDYVMDEFVLECVSMARNSKNITLSWQILNPTVSVVWIINPVHLPVLPVNHELNTQKQT